MNNNKKKQSGWKRTTLNLGWLVVVVKKNQDVGFARKTYRSSHLEVFIVKGALKICTKYTGEHPCRSNFIEITLRHGCSPVNSLHIFRTPSTKNTSGRLLLNVELCNLSNMGRQTLIKYCNGTKHKMMLKLSRFSSQ